LEPLDELDDELDELEELWLGIFFCGDFCFGLESGEAVFLGAACFSEELSEWAGDGFPIFG